MVVLLEGEKKSFSRNLRPDGKTQSLDGVDELEGGRDGTHDLEALLVSMTRDMYDVRNSRTGCSLILAKLRKLSVPACSNNCVLISPSSQLC